MRWYTAEGAIVNAQSAVARDMPESLIEQRFDQLLTRDGPALMRLAAAYTNTAGDRDDLFQEIVLAIWQALPSFRGESSERTFLFRIAHNRSISCLAGRHSVNLASEDEEARMSDPRPDPEQELAQEQERQQLLRAVRRLPISYRQVITLALEGLSYAEMADILAVSESNVGARLNRARQMLRSFMESRA